MFFAFLFLFTGYDMMWKFNNGKHMIISLNTLNMASLKHKKNTFSPATTAAESLCFFC